eukprot:TRINITY_DN10930_c0_g1_i4.p1 TRINITY_DN10930_c0_g1~~TRINITY_DN10930_c0_g1_i4.p1  ORF type:complete len:634 (+),score=50.60 TRINITY_DN10930_c0_g1_i4:106-2007(+)
MSKKRRWSLVAVLGIAAVAVTVWTLTGSRRRHRRRKPRIVRWHPVSAPTGWCCWNRARQSCVNASECDPGGEGCIASGSYTRRYGPVVCTPPAETHIFHMKHGGAGPRVALQIRGVSVGNGRSQDAASTPKGISELTFLVIDLHGGSMNDMISFLHNSIGIPAYNIMFLCMFIPYCRHIHRKWTAASRAGRSFGRNIISGEHRMAFDIAYPAAVSYALDGDTMLPLLHIINVSAASGFRWPVSDIVARAHTWATERSPKAHPIADILVCGVGAELCLALEPFVSHVIVRSMHRFDHASCGTGPSWLQHGGPERWMTGYQTGRMIQRLARSQHHLVAAGHVYDSAYMNHFLGVQALFWPALAADVPPAEYAPVQPKWQQLLLMPGWPDDHQNNWRVWLKAGVDLLASLGYSLDVPKAYYKHFKHSDLLTHRIGINIPYSIGSQLWYEMYRLGLPMYAPSLRMLTRLHLDHGLIFHRCCELQAHCPEPCYTAEDFGSNAVWEPPSVIWPRSNNAMRLPKHGSMNFNDTMVWLSLLEPYRYPHIEYFDSWEDLAGLLEKVTLEELRARSGRQQGTIRALEARSVLRVRKHLGALLAAGPAPRRARYSASVPAGLPHCDYTASAHTNFREAGHRIGV